MVYRRNSLIGINDITFPRRGSYTVVEARRNAEDQKEFGYPQQRDQYRCRWPRWDSGAEMRESPRYTIRIEWYNARTTISVNCNPADKRNENKIKERSITGTVETLFSESQAIGRYTPTRGHVRLPGHARSRGAVCTRVAAKVAPLMLQCSNLSLVGYIRWL